MNTTTTPGPCDRCATARVCLVLPIDEVLDEQGEFRDDLQEKWACPECDVFPVFNIDDTVDGGIWQWVSRDPTHPEWAWLPDWMRAPAAKFGLCVDQWTHEGGACVFVDICGVTWVTDGKHVLSLREKTADETSPRASLFFQAGWPTWHTGTAVGLSDPYQRKPDEPHVVDCGSVVIPARSATLVAELYPGATWEASGFPNPAVASLDGVPVAMVTPVMPEAA